MLPDPKPCGPHSIAAGCLSQGPEARPATAALHPFLNALFLSLGIIYCSVEVAVLAVGNVLPPRLAAASQDARLRG